MKFIMSAALLSATAAIAFTACTDRLDEGTTAPETTPETTVDSKIVEAAAYAPSDNDATAKSSTRTEFTPVTPGAHEGYTVGWSSGDEVLTVEFLNQSTNPVSAEGYKSEVAVSGNNSSLGSFAIKRNDSSATSWDYISFYPSTAVVKTSNISSPYYTDYSSYVTITVPRNQQPKPDSPDPAASVMAAWAQNITSWEDDSQIKFDFKHLVAYGNMTLTHLNEDVFEGFNKVSSVTFAVPDDQPAITGTFNAYSYLEELTNNMDSRNPSHYNSSATNIYRDVTVTYAEPLTVTTDGKVNVWFAIVPTRDPGDTSKDIRTNGVSEFTVTMTMTNDSGDTKIFTRNVKIASNEGANTNNIRFATNKVSSFSVNMAKAKTDGDEEDDDITSPEAAVQKAVVVTSSSSARTVSATANLNADLPQWTIESWVRYDDNTSEYSGAWTNTNASWRGHVYCAESYPFSTPQLYVVYPLNGQADCPNWQFAAIDGKMYNTKTYAQGGFYWGPDQWVHLSFTYDGNELKVYTNGIINDFVSNSSATAAYENLGQSFPKTDLTSWSVLNIVRSGNGSGINGTTVKVELAQMRLWSKALTAEEIKENMHNNIPKNTEGLYSYWRMDELNEQGQIVDVLGHANIVKTSGTFSMSDQTYTFADEGKLGMGQPYAN